MICFSFTALVFLGSLSSISAQQPEEWLKTRFSFQPIEKIYLHLDRSRYLAGQSIWFKAYLMSDFEPDLHSTSLVVELADLSGQLINRQFLPVFAGLARGQIDLPDTIRSGACYLRAYVAGQQHTDPAYLYKKTVLVYRPGSIPPASVTAGQLFRLEFFPEGGNLIAGLSNSVAFKATDETGLPVAVEGVIQNEKGETITSFSAMHDGMGYFDLTAGEQDRYFAVVGNGSASRRFPLPDATTRGVVFRIISNGPTKSFEILQREDNPDFRAAFMIGQQQHHPVFRKDFAPGDRDLTGLIPQTGLASGILQVTVFNRQGLPLAERLTFVDNREYRLQAALDADTLDFSKRGRNHFSLRLSEPVSGSFSVSVTDADFEPESCAEHIFSSMLLSSDLKGYIYRPAYYFSSASDSVQAALDLVMMINGWRRFNWSERNHSITAEKPYRDPGYLRLSGRAVLKDSHRPFAGKDLMAMIFSQVTGRKAVMLHTNEQGYFSVDSVLFFGRSRILFTDIKGKKSKDIDISLDADSLLIHSIRPPTLPGDYPPLLTMGAEQEKTIAAALSEVARAEGLLLGGITVQAKSKTPQQQLEARYVSPLFAGDANAALDLTAEDLTAYQNILDYLSLRVAGLQVARESDGFGYTVNYRQSALASSMGVMPMSIYLDEVPADADVLASIPANQIALVKVFSGFVGASGNAPGGLLAVYTRKGSDREGLNSSGDLLVRNGYSVIREYYSPSYPDPRLTKPDNRITLLWNPTLTAAGPDTRVPIFFFNNDRARRYHVVVEGMTTDGRLVFIEKFFSQRAF